MLRIINLFLFSAATNRAFHLPSLIRRPLVNAFLEDFDMTSLIVLLQQICQGLSRYSLVVSPDTAKQEKTITTTNTEDQIIEMREFLGQFVIDVVLNLKNKPEVLQITQNLLEVIYFCVYFLKTCYI